MLISFGYINKKSLLFLAVPTASVIRFLLTNIAKDQIKGNENIFFSPFLKLAGRSLHCISLIILENMTLSKKKNNKNNKDSSLIIPDPNDPYFLSDDKSERHNSMYSLYQSDYYVKRKLEKKKI